MITKDPSMEEPAFSSNVSTTGVQCGDRSGKPVFHYMSVFTKR
ncbi:MAG: hypothetical protein WBQ23_11795 [Bacteroidota bacterium]